MILEGILTTINEDESVNISPMGALVDRDISSFVLRPYKTSRTYRNLKRTARAIFHVTDDVDLLAKAAVGKLDPLPNLDPAPDDLGWVLTDSCRWYGLRVTRVFDDAERTTIECSATISKTLREFFGFNRAKHAVVEAAILATRLHLLPENRVRDEIERLSVIVGKTGGDQEQAAFQFLESHIATSWKN